LFSFTLFPFPPVPSIVRVFLISPSLFPPPLSWNMLFSPPASFVFGVTNPFVEKPGYRFCGFSESAFFFLLLGSPQRGPSFCVGVLNYQSWSWLVDTGLYPRAYLFPVVKSPNVCLSCPLAPPQRQKNFDQEPACCLPSTHCPCPRKFLFLCPSFPRMFDPLLVAPPVDRW